MTTKTQSMKEKNDHLDFIKINTSTVCKTLLREEKDKPQTRRKYLQIKYLIKDLYPECITNSQNSL